MLTSLREKKKRRTRAEILAAAAACIEREGYRNANMRDIAAAADVAYQTLYNYFPSKARIAMALLARDLEHEGSAPDDDADIVELLGALACAIVGLVSTGDREVWRDVFVEAIRNAETPVIRYLDPGIDERLVELLRAAQQHGRLDAYLDAAAMASIIESLLSSAVLDLATMGEHDERSARASIVQRIEIALGPYVRAAG